MEWNGNRMAFTRAPSENPPRVRALYTAPGQAALRFCLRNGRETRVRAQSSEKFTVVTTRTFLNGLSA